MNNSNIKDWPAGDRPREKMLGSGAESLSDAELVAILLRSGTRGQDVLSFARDLLNKKGGLRGLLASSPSELSAQYGMGLAKAASISAVAELARRQAKEQMAKRNVVSDPESMVQYLNLSLRDKKREVFKVIFLDKGNRVLAERDMFHGTIDQAAVHPREIIKAALEYHATNIILVHNHPSGRAYPSQEDRLMTQKIKAACETINIKVLDHIIVGDNQHFSFLEYKML